MSETITEQSKGSSGTMTKLVLELVRPYRAWLIVVIIAMVVETAMSMAGPWPLKIVIDNVLGHHPLPDWLHWVRDLPLAQSKMGLAAIAAITVILIAVISGVATYIDNYYTESVGQWVANDLRVRMFDHLQRLSLGYYEKQQTGVLLSTITNDVTTLQNFASSAMLGILIDLFTIVGIVGLMFWLNWDFALVAVGVTPFLLFFVARFKRAVKKAQHEVRREQANIVTVVQEGLESVRVVKAFGRQDLEQARLGEVSQATVAAALKARRVKSLLSPMVTVVVAACTAFVLWRGASLIIAGAMTIGALTVFLAYLSKFFKPVQDLAKMTNSIAQATVAVERIQAILDTDNVIAEHAQARELAAARGEIVFEHVAFGYEPNTPVLRDVNFRIGPGQMVGLVGTTGGGKSTIVRLIPRFYDANVGRVLIDGVDVKGLHQGIAAERHRLRPPGHRAVSGNHPREHRLWPADTRPKPTSSRGSEARERPRFHQPHAAGLRHTGRRTRLDAIGWPAPAHRHRPSHHPQVTNPHSRRTDGGSGH